MYSGELFRFDVVSLTSGLPETVARWPAFGGERWAGGAVSTKNWERDLVSEVPASDLMPSNCLDLAISAISWRFKALSGRILVIRCDTSLTTVV